MKNKNLVRQKTKKVQNYVDNLTVVWGAIFGDVIGAPYEYPWRGRTTSRDFTLLSKKSKPTDDSILTLAIMQSFLDIEGEERDLKILGERVDYNLRNFAAKYPDSGYGKGFKEWLKGGSNNSLGNGAAMRVSPVAYVAKTEEEVLELAAITAAVSHAHPEGIAGAQAVALAVFLALHAHVDEENPVGKVEIIEKVSEVMSPVMEEMDLINPESYDHAYKDSVATAYPSVPQALACFFSTSTVEEAVRAAVACGQDGDTQAAIAASVAFPFYGTIPTCFITKMPPLPSEFFMIIDKFSRTYNIPKLRIEG